MSTALRWLRELEAAAPQLPVARSPRPYWSQRRSGSSETATYNNLAEVATRVRRLISELENENFFAQVLGYDCVDGYGEGDSTPEDELGRRVGKPHLWDADPELWSEDDLWDFIEVFHDLAARPTQSSYHSYSGCGWHPKRFSRSSGQALYRWFVNELLERSTFEMRLADEGEDVGRVIRSGPAALTPLMVEMASSATHGEVPHAVALFRSRDATREDKRSAIFNLGRVLERNRELLKQELFSKDEGALFDIANSFDLRHSRRGEQSNYDDVFLDWIFYWYLATVELIDRLVARRTDSRG